MTTEHDSGPPVDDHQSRHNAVQNASVSSPSAGGIFLALGCIVGAIIGGFLGQPSLGFVLGLGAGALAATGIWLFKR